VRAFSYAAEEIAMNGPFSRSTSRTVHFARPFMVPGLGGVQPPGDYLIETEEELLDGLSFDAWRRVATTIRLPRRPDGPPVEQVVRIDPAAIEKALAIDAASLR
jgi:hypothetical protein